jgi:hypothetical protein
MCIQKVFELAARSIGILCADLGVSDNRKDFLPLQYLKYSLKAFLIQRLIYFIIPENIFM